jgi:hypothetical protein
MSHALSDEDVGRQILGIFIRYNVPANGTLMRSRFFDVRDGDFKRGITNAVANKWIVVNWRNHHQFTLTPAGLAAGRAVEPIVQGGGLPNHKQRSLIHLLR